MRTPFIGFINNIKPGRDQEIKINQGKKEENVDKKGNEHFKLSIVNRMS